MNLVASMPMPNDAEVVEQIGDCRHHMDGLYVRLRRALNGTFNIGEAFQCADDLSLTFADHQRLERLAARRGLRVKPWPDRDRYDEAADLAIATHPDEWS
jgi:hypothetical protein